MTTAVHLTSEKVAEMYQQRLYVELGRILFLISMPKLSVMVNLGLL